MYMTINKVNIWNAVNTLNKQPQCQIIIFLGAGATLFAIYKYYKFKRETHYHSILKKYYSSTYEEAREKFTKSCKEHNFLHHRVPILQNPNATYSSNHDDSHSKRVIKQHTDEHDCSIDLGFIRGSDDTSQLIIHASGTHGAEGFAGSAIQSHLINNYLSKELNHYHNYNYKSINIHSNETKERIPSTNKNNIIMPHILFVHGLNGYGMKYIRRCNSYNVDLKYNMVFDPNIAKLQLNSKLSKKNHNDMENVYSNLSLPDRCLNIFTKIKNTRDHSDYNKISYLLNPTGLPFNIGYFSFISNYIKSFSFYFNFFKILFNFGMNTFINGVINGQYIDSNGLFYGGNKLENENYQLIQFLKNDCANTFGVDLCNMIENVIIIDTHTGTGPSGIDTLLCTEEQFYKIGILYPIHKRKNRIQKNKNIGWNGYSKLFKNVQSFLAIVQEFGTVSELEVGRVLTEENRVFTQLNGRYEYDSYEKQILKKQKEFKRAFYCENDVKWKVNVLERGIKVFDNAVHCFQSNNKVYSDTDGWNYKNMSVDILH